MRRAVVLLLVIASVVAIQASAPAVGTFATQKGPATIPGPPLGIVWKLQGRNAMLARLDPSTLAPTGERVVLGRSVSTWSYDPADRRLAISSKGVSVRFVDVDKMRTLGDVRVARDGSRINSLTWLFPDRFLAVSTSSAGSQLVWIDGTKRRVLQRRALDVLPWTVVGGGSTAVALLPPPWSIASARLAVAGADGRLRITSVPRIQIGFSFPDQRDRGFVRRVSPGLAVTSAGERAYLVGGAGVVAEVDLHTLGVSYHSPQRPRSFASRLGRWLVPTAQAKGTDGPWVHARWLGNGILAVAGGRYHVLRPESRGLRQIVEPAGLRLIDTRTWTQRTLDERASGFTLSGDTIIAFGIRSEWAGTQTTFEGMGIAAYGPDGTKRFEALSGEPIGLLQASNGRGYARRTEPGSPRQVVVVDLADGGVEQELVLEHPTWLLLESDGS